MTEKLINKEKKKVSSMFNSIAPKYDFLNHFLSAGIDKRWRKITINKIAEVNPKLILDVATGTADLAIKAAELNPDSIVGVDIAKEMLEVGRKKIENKGLNKIITLKPGDSLNLDFSDDSFDVAMVAFGVRNFEDLEKGLFEMHRVLKPGGMIAILEFSNPQKFPIKQFYHFYSKIILPFFGRLISGDASAYTYLPETVKQFPCGSRFTSILNNVGFQKTVFKPLTFEIATLYTGIK